ncbi:MAG: hypothetical protein ACKVOA_08730 [Methylophilaceae bacterium]
MSENELIPNTIILGERNYSAALDLVIAQAKDELLIFDQDFERSNYASLARYQLLHDFLSNNPLSKLNIILHSAEFFTSRCPRLFDLLETYSHKMTVFVTNDHAKIAKDCFVLSDGRHYCRRFHINQARFKFALDDAEMTASLTTRFNELLEETAESVSVTKLGL